LSQPQSKNLIFLDENEAELCTFIEKHKSEFL
jgi:hypothetical protein